MLKGETTLNLTAAFSPFSEGALTRASQTPPGRGFNNLSDLVVLIYDKDGNILKDSNGAFLDYGVREIRFEQSEVKNENRNPSDASNGATAETDTKCLKNISLNLPFGEYYIIGVANFGDYRKNGETDDILVDKSSYVELTTTYADDIQTLDGLRKINVSWDGGNYTNNREMLGYFTDPDAETPKANSYFPTVKVNKPGMNLRAWLRRCASKITVDFDGSGLRDNVYIYVKSVTVKDLASSCTLGFGNNPVVDEMMPTYNNSAKNKEDLIETSTHHIDFGEGDNYGEWPCITKGSPYIMENGERKDFHSQDADALYFYENMQGDAPYGKVPVADLEQGGVKDSSETKDGVDLGTYVEVTAHYHSDANGNVTDGDIKYRFMIGKDAEKDCNAERNYHYKLTLKFRGNANDYDWHIDYTEEPGFDVPNPWYVSYLYNHAAMLPFKYTPKKGYELVRVEAEIITNPWYPSKIDEAKLKDPTIPITGINPYGDEPGPYSNPDNHKNCNGFLSLRYSEKTVITDVEASGAPFPTKDGTTDYKAAGANVINEKYYTGQLPGTVDRSKRTYELIGEDDTRDSETEGYSFTKAGTTYTLNIPVFTRAKVLVKQTGYSGNNPFVGYQRVARVRLTPYVRKEGTTDTPVADDWADVNVVQVRRVVNPKGVYRRADNYDPFEVRMMWLDGDDKDEFTEATSHGPWIAEIIGDNNFITLNGRQTVSGGTETPINFTINFNRTNKSAKNAVVRVRYHNYTCTHLIFVRQGYVAQSIAPSGTNLNGSSQTATVWEPCNMIARNKRADDPRDEGSLFRFGNSTYPIDAINNVYKDNAGKILYKNLEEKDFSNYMNSVLGPFFTTDLNGNLRNDTKDKIAWSSITIDAAGFTSGSMAKAATMRDFEQLYRTEHVQFGYGVLYADGATKTQSKLEDAYGYYRRDTKTGDSHKGMRGMFVYYWDGKITGGSNYNGRNVFFPIGRSGYGHRKNRLDIVTGVGILRYASSRGVPAEDLFSFAGPIFVSQYRRPGAIYWSRNSVEQYMIWNGTVEGNANNKAFGLDINYFSFDVNSITSYNIDSGQDACFVRCVVE
jgi:hypothetical protein